MDKSIVPISIIKVEKKELKNYFINTWQLTEILFSSIKEEGTYYINPDSRRHPLIFYFGHVAALYINKLRIAGLFNEKINSKFENLFAVGVDPSTKDDLENYGWPEYHKVVEFRNIVYNTVLSLIESKNLPENIDWHSPYWAILMAIEHERIHFETSSVLIRQYVVELVSKPSDWFYTIDNDFNPEVGFVDIEAGNVTLGRPIDSKMYGWDNEYGIRNCFVEKFSVGKNMITNKEYLLFVEDGGYNTKEFWSEPGWEWIKSQGINSPKFWLEKDGHFLLRAMFDIVEMPWNWPVEIIAHEAEAFCRWKGSEYRLLSEVEWKLLTDRYFNDEHYDFDNFGEFNTNFSYGSPTPVGYFKSQNPPFDIMGNVWEILSDDFYPLNGFKEHPYYKDFSLPFFDSDHGMLAGGSWASTGNSASRYYRLWFRRDFVQHAGFRLVKSI